jgi:anti-anti-sigma regulatory factor
MCWSDGEAVPQLRQVLATARQLKPPALTLDLTAASYVSLSAMGALLVARSGALDARAVVLMPGVSGQFRRLLTRLDLAGAQLERP